MSNDINVYGTCKYQGQLDAIEIVLKEWGINDLLLAPQEGEFALDGEYRDSSMGPRGPVEEDYLIACLREIAKAVRIETAEFRCYGPGWDSAYDVIYTNGDFLTVPLELQPTLEALDDPVVRDHYGLDYCVAQSN
ncbi:MAG: hypothetical protein HDKAJFGB_04086 [Anaerolineae bacterium]|nr:hypothetical protein [Anaerolineae bacterium]